MNSHSCENNFILHERLTRLRHKLYGIKYYYDSYIEEEKRIMGNYNENYAAVATNSEYQNSKLIYSLESFLYQYKSALDVLSQVIRIIFDLSDQDTYAIIKKNKQNKVVKELLEKDTFLCKELASVLSKNDNNILNIIDMRDEVTHISDLKGFLCFIEYAWDGSEYAYISYPSMPDGKPAYEFMVNSLNLIYKMLMESLPILINQLSKK